jgi:hypothetical protein
MKRVVWNWFRVKGEESAVVQHEENTVPRPRTDGADHRQSPENPILTTRVGLKIPPIVSFDAWERLGVQISRIADSSAWCLGDWLVYGQQEYADRYRRAIEVAGLDYQTLRNYAWVARRFELWRRRDKLSFQHHAEVAALDIERQDYFLDRAEQAGWSRNHLRRKVREERVGAAADTRTMTLPRLSVPVEHVERWREAAEAAGEKFEQWVVAALDQMATQALAEHIVERVPHLAM